MTPMLVRRGGAARDPVVWRESSDGCSYAHGVPDRAAALADIVLRDHADREVRLGDLWADRPAVLVWLRHYG